jgi:hypothetical protein
LLGQVTVPAEVPPVPPAVVERTTVVQPAEAEFALAGQILRTKLVDLRGTTEKALVALLDTGDGQRQIVDLGPVVNFKATPIRTGDQIAVRGARVTLGQMDVLVATDVNLGSDAVSIKRVVPRTVAAVAVAAGYPVTEQILKIDGRIEHLRMARLRGSVTEHMIAELVNRNGGAVVVDLGPPAALWRADLKAGEWITVKGQQMKINNRPVLLALEINKTGVPYLIERNLVHEGPAVLAP